MLQMRSKRCKVRGHRAIAPFSGVGRIVLTGTLRGEFTPLGKSDRVELLNGGFRATVASTRFLNRLHWSK
jgi:hypothetical protein